MVKRLSQRSVAARSRVRFPLVPQMQSKWPIILIVFISAGTLFLYLNSDSKSNEAAGFSRERILMEDRIKEAGAENAYAELKDTFAEKHFSAQHTAVHLFGEVLYENSGVSGVTVCDGSFSFGCFHGFFAGAMAERGAGIVKELDEACIAEFGEYSGRLSGCRHGIGHGLMEYYGNDLTAALEGCRLTAEKSFKLGCASGIFMEYNIPLVFSAESATVVPRDFDSGNPQHPCDSVNAEFRYSCWFELPQWLFITLPNIADIASVCSGAETSTDREACMLGLGFYIAPDTDYNPDESAAACDSITKGNDRVSCRTGAAFGFMVNPKNQDLYEELCADLNAEARQKCLSDADLFQKI